MKSLAGVVACAAAVVGLASVPGTAIAAEPGVAEQFTVQVVTLRPCAIRTFSVGSVTFESDERVRVSGVLGAWAPEELCTPSWEPSSSSLVISARNYLPNSVAADTTRIPLEAAKGPTEWVAFQRYDVTLTADEWESIVGVSISAEWRQGDHTMHEYEGEPVYIPLTPSPDGT
ncbi:hypothetical protein [Streptomyces specialis]|uniref:hypothetical protein n=1 Tax=Streptomyces specialis TaxID=498367 RepID=UPI00073EFBCC|nr:hypothetical protein [Streptomyces specialis]